MSLHTPMIHALALTLLAAQDVAPALDPVVAARALLPAYDYDPTLVTSDAELAGVYSAIQLLEEAAAAEPERADLLWWRAHCDVLLAEERAARGDRAGAEVRYANALALYDQAEALQPDDVWTTYARGVALRQTGRPFEAIGSFDRTTALATEAAATAAEGEPRNTLLFLDMKARRFRADARLATFDFAAAAGELDAWFDAPDEHAWWVNKSDWTRAFELAGVHQRARDLAAVRVLMEGVVANEEYAQYASPHEQLGYVSGLLGENARALEELERAANREDPPGLYTRMWRAILAEGEAADATRATLREFVDYPPPDLSAWDRALGRFVLGDEEPEAFLSRARDENRRRIAAREPLDDLDCEAWFYAGLRWEQTGDVPRALAAYRECLAYPVPFKWEWEYARLHLSALARSAGLATDAGFAITDGRIARVTPGSLAWRLGLRPGVVVSARVHRPGTPRATPELGALEPGDLVQLVVRGDERQRAVAVVVDAR